ncbi:endolytic transglycosylase MltG [Nocardiopsis ganjiahuensis]|uniref:endolytic transglycosylase MltG n=1 Tax=Nocardiopsis ganjiahuensis TaxID=239984 RepID=UPI00034CC8BC|nr:endolytic transglycosylase MltG [Nocardiopsis ganjiahuensis]
MTDRDDYPDPYRGRADREGGYDYDPLTDPLPAQPPSRGRRARPEPQTSPWADQPGTGEFQHTEPSTGEFRTPRYTAPESGEFDTQNRSAPPPGRRRRAEPPADEAPWSGEQPTAPPRRFGAADALRGSRAARGGGQGPQRPAQGSPSDTGSHQRPTQGSPSDTGSHQRPVQGSPSDTGSHQRPGSDPTQDALAALANLGGAQSPSAPQGPRPSQGPPTSPGARGESARGPAEDPARDQPPRRSRRSRSEDAGEPRSAFWGDDADEPTPAFLADEPDEEPRGRRARRKRAKEPEEGPPHDTGAFAVPEDEEPKGRRARRKRAKQADAEQPVRDTGAFAAQEAEEPAGRRGRRRARRAAEEEPHDSGAFAAAPAAPVADTGAFAELSDPDRQEPVRDTGSFPAQEPEDEAPKGRGGRRRARRGRRAEPEPAPEPSAEEESRELEDEDLYEEDSLEDIAASYGDSRANRKRAKRAKAAQAARRKAGKPKKRRSKGLMILLALVLMLVVAGGGYGVMRTYVFPPDFSGEGEGEVVFTIEEGQSGTAVAQSLVDEGVVASVRAFTNALDSQEGEGVVPGTYSLAEGMSGESAVAALLDPENRIGRGVTIREGLRSEQVLQKLSENTGLSLEELQAAYEQTDELGLPDYATEGPAGYLFPSTYRFDPDTEALSMLRTMVTQHTRVAEELELESKAEALGYDANEIMAIASIVQAESGGAEDMPKISRVVHNRLEDGMALQMDSTCFYAIGEYGIALDNDQLAACEADTSGFDTYHKPGLPPGPFVAPGQDAIEAALEPEEGDWLYFVATDPENGVTEFAETYEEFEVLKQRFQETWGGGSEE